LSSDCQGDPDASMSFPGQSISGAGQWFIEVDSWQLPDGTDFSIQWTIDGCPSTDCVNGTTGMLPDICQLEETASETLLAWYFQSSSDGPYVGESLNRERLCTRVRPRATRNSDDRKIDNDWDAAGRYIGACDLTIARLDPLAHRSKPPTSPLGSSVRQSVRRH